TLVGFDGKYAQIKLPSGEIRLVLSNCMATLGSIGNSEHENILHGKAGRKRWMGIRPQTRGIAMNPIDHPNGGGEGRSKSGGGRKHLRSPWGQLSKGLKTRKRKKASTKLIIRKRK
ncbi:MAG: 50S ribosomal protein L2, partial [bacterium]